MDITGEHRIPAPREEVWRALNDPEILRQAIPGCKSLEKLSDTEFKGAVTAKIGPVNATFNGEVTLRDLDPPNGYVLSGKGQGGAAGFASGEVKVTLAEDGAETVLTYQADAKIGGKLAQLGARLIDGTVKKMAGEFFTNFSALLGPAEAAAPEAAAEAPAAAEEKEEGASPAVWAAFIIAVIALLLWAYLR